MELQYLKGIGPKRQQLLQRLGIVTVEDLLEHYPRRYEDRTKVVMIAELIPDEVNTCIAEVINIIMQRPRPQMTILKVIIRDETGIAAATWFNQAYLQQKFYKGMKLLLTGRVQLRAGMRELLVQDFEILDAEQVGDPGKIVPYYPLVKGLNQQVVHKIILEALRLLPPAVEFYPDDFRFQHHLINRQAAIEGVHRPESWELLNQAKRRLIFDEFFLLQLTLLTLRYLNQQQRLGIMHDNYDLTKDWLASLPFTLTQAQRRVIQEVEEDMASSQTMQRLVQGDVGSGKTVIAAWAILQAVSNGYQGIMMAPTEILAQQHYETLSDWFKPLNIQVSLLTGGLSSNQKAGVLLDIQSGKSQVIIGTHALFQQNVDFANLSLIVIDEQHRFGVKQRSLLEEKGKSPDVLVMSATPIPRTLALSIYGDLDISTLDELPPGRKPIKTICILEKARAKLYALMQSEIEKGFQAYIVCPLIEESEILDLQNAEKLYENLKQVFPKYQVGLMHGRLKVAEKEKVMQQFSQGHIQLLVSTTVIEVGVNVPKATLMVIENADRFGLAQLHQLRGRVGRGGDQSYCILVTQSTNELALKRLKLMTESNDGFRLAEEDMLLRGPGEFFGTRQHGLPEFRLAELPRDFKLLEEARNTALALLKVDPGLMQDGYQALSEIIRQKLAKMVKV